MSRGIVLRFRELEAINGHAETETREELGEDLWWLGRARET